jgi:hypothetical protein
VVGVDDGTDVADGVDEASHHTVPTRSSAPTEPRP